MCAMLSSRAKESDFMEVEEDSGMEDITSDQEESHLSQSLVLGEMDSAVQRNNEANSRLSFSGEISPDPSFNPENLRSPRLSRVSPVLSEKLSSPPCRLVSTRLDEVRQRLENLPSLEVGTEV